VISTSGSPADPAVLLVAGNGASMDWWEPGFCQSLEGRYVIRYDHRDTGDAPSYPPGRPGYTGHDLVRDAVAVLDEVGVGAAHVVGLSMGGALAQVLTLDHPARVRSLTAISTTAGAGDGDLPGMSPALGAAFQELVEPDWTDDDAVVEYLVDSQRIMAAAPFDDEETRAVARIAVSRTKNNESSQKNHMATEDEGPWRHRLPEISVPTLVLHGDQDPLFPLPHGEALAREIPGARLVVLPRTGHEFPRRNWPLVAKEVLALTAGG
jgi:pimeloyl-ACP methyl ester carboxylesterase